MKSFVTLIGPYVQVTCSTRCLLVDEEEVIRIMEADGWVIEHAKRDGGVIGTFAVINWHKAGQRESMPNERLRLVELLK